MKLKKIVILLIFITSSLLYSQNKNSGIEIYLVKKENLDLNYENYKGGKQECIFCLDLKKDDLYDSPLITYNDIKNFDWDNQQITLTDTAQKRINNLAFSSFTPVAMVLNGEIIYGFWFWGMASSAGCDRVYTFPKYRSNGFKIEFGLPENFTFGEDPRFDKRLKDFLKK
ncbi:hypothetical protein [Aureivirga sp. CE67]|uniref:hypothetical protein n=1 Tax=Aureivirga sp. CE67 TaxID=1788983 RepID=UPI0018CA84AA|nr:hypothetical protein [Aureivirga sp. CE67]